MLYHWTAFPFPLFSPVRTERVAALRVRALSFWLAHQNCYQILRFILLTLYQDPGDKNWWKETGLFEDGLK
jgi:hypothetical protein